MLFRSLASTVPFARNAFAQSENDRIVAAAKSVGKTDLRGLAGVLSRASLLVANDSSPMHIAAAVKTAVVALFGPSKSVETAPWGEGHVVVEKDFPCRARCDEDVCKFVHHNQCMKDIKVEDVFSALRAVLKAKRDDGKKRQKTLH